jgi:hypothetical protein
MRDHSMFNFLVNESSGNKPDLDILQEFAKQAAHAYLSMEKVALNDSISKIAQVETLSPNEIAIICQESNKLVHTELFKEGSDKYTIFDLAKPEQIISGLEAGEKTASAKVDDYSNPPSKGEDDFVVCKTAGHSGFCKTASTQKKEKLEKLAAERQRIKDDYYGINTELENLETKFVKIARNMLLPYNIDERQKYFPAIYSFCKKSGVSNKTSQRLVSLLSQVMEKQGLLNKVADMKAGDDLISDNLNARVINGDHPLYVVVKTIPEVEDKKKLYQERHNIIQERINVCGADGAILGQHGKML